MSSYSYVIKKALKDKFGDYFRVVCAHHQTYRVEYTDGVPEEEIEKFVAQFEIGYFDGMTDSYVVCNRNGFARYIFVTRKMSSEARDEILEKIKKEFGEEIILADKYEQQRRLGPGGLEGLIYRIFSAKTFPFRKK